MANQVDCSPELLAYVREISLREDPVLRDLRDATEQLPAGRHLQVMAEEGQFLALLVALTGARTVLEIGTFTGYSTLCMARALPPGGRLVTCDITEKWPDIAVDFWRRAAVADRINVRIGRATDTLESLTHEWGAGSVDLTFIDGDKASYRTYYEQSLTLTRAGGLIVIDNTLLFGRVLDRADHDPDTVAIRELNALLHGDERVDVSLLPFADGVTLVRKREA